eukprot:Gb_31744 [translate_table: standard]
MPCCKVSKQNPQKCTSCRYISARLESERETEALRNYLSEVEAAAAGLQSRVHELEHLISFSSKDETRELDQLRAKLATEASKESRSQAVAAARSVAAAREATMELDRIYRAWYRVKISFNSY